MEVKYASSVSALTYVREKLVPPEKQEAFDRVFDQYKQMVGTLSQYFTNYEEGTERWLYEFAQMNINQSTYDQKPLFQRKNSANLTALDKLQHSEEQTQVHSEVLKKIFMSLQDNNGDLLQLFSDLNRTQKNYVTNGRTEKWILDIYTADKYADFTGLQKYWTDLHQLTKKEVSSYEK